MQRTKSACLIELSASMKPLAAYKVTEREGTEGSGRYGLAELVPRSGIVSLSFRAERSQAERPGLWPEGVAAPPAPAAPAPPPPGPRAPLPLVFVCRCIRAGNKARDFVNSEKNIRGDTAAEARALSQPPDIKSPGTSKIVVAAATVARVHAREVTGGPRNFQERPSPRNFGYILIAKVTTAPGHRAAR
ncbi:hypothetical protein Q8A67_008227 [Cirrhinus molitorella]|nr:hypothetical protein Q8A67_008227 [Cirrhinus molitorella]